MPGGVGTDGDQYSQPAEHLGRLIITFMEQCELS